MPLQFPTMAEKCLEEFARATKTVSLAALARRQGADIEQEWDSKRYVFDDDSALRVRGTGKNHKVEVELP